MKRPGSEPKQRAMSASRGRWGSGLAISATLLFVHNAAAEQATPTTVTPATPVASHAPRRTAPAPVATTRLRFDVNVEGGAGSRTSVASVLGLGRLRLGLLAMIEPTTPDASPLYVAIGPVFQANGVATASLGLEAELTHVTSGLWYQGTALVDLGTTEPAWAASIGWSIFGVALERHVEDDGSGPHAVTAVFGKLRAPLGIAWHSFR